MTPPYMQDFQKLFQPTKDGEIEQAWRLLQSVPFRVAVSGPADRLAQLALINLGFFYGGKWKIFAIEVPISEFDGWFLKFQQVFNEAKASWEQLGSPREGYSNGQVWQNL